MPPAHGWQLLQLSWPVAFWNVAVAHAVQLDAPAAEYEPAAHASHDVCPSRDWYCPDTQFSQCSAALTAPDPAIFPATHATHADCPVNVWYLPTGHSEQLALFVVAAKRPKAQSSHARSAVALGACFTRVPAAHTLCARHAACPTWSWNEPSAHAVHANASSAPATWPTAQFVHTRSVLVVGAALWYMPLRQRCTLKHTVLPGDGWNCPLSHTAHALLALAFWIWPGAHALQY